MTPYKGLMKAPYNNLGWNPLAARVDWGPGPPWNIIWLDPWAQSHAWYKSLYNVCYLLHVSMEDLVFFILIKLYSVLAIGGVIYYLWLPSSMQNKYG